MRANLPSTGRETETKSAQRSAGSLPSLRWADAACTRGRRGTPQRTSSFIASGTSEMHGTRDPRWSLVSRRETRNLENGWEENSPPKRGRGHEGKVRVHGVRRWRRRFAPEFTPLASSRPEPIRFPRAPRRSSHFPCARRHTSSRATAAPPRALASSFAIQQEIGPLDRRRGAGEALNHRRGRPFRPFSLFAPFSSATSPIFPPFWGDQPRVEIPVLISAGVLEGTSQHIFAKAESAQHPTNRTAPTRTE